MFGIAKKIWLGWIRWKLLISRKCRDATVSFLMRELLACALHMFVESRPPRVEWMPVHPLTIRLVKSGNRHNHASWFLTICWTSYIMILHLLVIRFALLSRERMSMFSEISGKELSSIARRPFCFPMHSDVDRVGTLMKKLSYEMRHARN